MTDPEDTLPDGIPLAAILELFTRDTLVDPEEAGANDFEDGFPTEAA